VKARVHITLKTGVLDPQGRAIAHALAGLGFDGVEDVRQGKVLELTVADTDPVTARERIEDMCRRLLANPVIETWTIEVDGSGGGRKAG